MDLPAELHRRVEESESEPLRVEDILVARGPLVIMAYGLMSIDPRNREHFFITSPAGELDAKQTAWALRRWTSAH